MIVFTNGCFDIIHAGHIDLLSRARALGSRLIVGINSDDSVRKIKGTDRPIQNQDARKAVLLSLRSVDDVIIFNEPTPERLIVEIEPDILVKGGDWKADEIIGADFVRSYGGKVFSLPLLSGFSSSAIIDNIRGAKPPDTADGNSVVEKSINQHLDVIGLTLVDCASSIDDAANVILNTFQRGNKVLICGNGGSAADAQHIAAEFVGRYESERRGLAAISLTTDTSALTSLANDYDFTRIFARQVEALAVKGDCLVAISTSGTSPNVIAAVMAARKLGCNVIGLTGSGGKKLASLSDHCVMIPSYRTARIQEAHITVAHIWCEIIDAAFTTYD